MQGEDSNFHTDLFVPMLARGWRSSWGGRTTVARRALLRVLADHARAVTFLLADGVYPGNEGRGYVLRRILRRAVRHAWLLGRQRADADAAHQIVCGDGRRVSGVAAKAGTSPT